MIPLNAVSSFPSFWLAYTILCQHFKWFGSCGLLRPEAFGRWRTEDFISCNLIMENAWTSAISVTHCDTLMQKSLIALLQAGSCTPICPGKATERWCLFKLFATDTCDVRTVKLKRWPRCMASKKLNRSFKEGNQHALLSTRLFSGFGPCLQVTNSKVEGQHLSIL